MKWPIRPIMLSVRESQIPKEEGIGHKDHQQESPGQHEDDAQAGLAIEKLSKGPASFSPAGSRRGGKRLGTTHLILQKKGSLQADGCPSFTHHTEKYPPGLNGPDHSAGPRF